MYTVYFLKDNQAQKLISQLFKNEIPFVVDKSWFNVISITVYDHEDFVKQLEKEIKA